MPSVDLSKLPAHAQAEARRQMAKGRPYRSPPEAPLDKAVLGAAAERALGPKRVTLDLPFPPALNCYYRSVNGRVLISREGREYRKWVFAMPAVAGFHGFGAARLAVHIEAYPPDRRRRDLDGMLKCLLDTLQACRLYDDDGQIDELSIHRALPVAGGKVRVVVEAIFS